MTRSSSLAKWCYSIEPKYRIFVKSYEFLSLTENMSKNIGKSVSDRYSQKLLDNARQSAADLLKASSKSVIKNSKSNQ